MTCEKVGYDSRPQVYRCEICGQFHWGHRRPARTLSTRRRIRYREAEL
jgi:hypothetical protein